MRPCTIIGNVGGDPELRFSGEGTPVCNFSLALYAGEDKDKNSITTWVRVSCWKGLAETVNARVKKGDKIQVEGFLMPVEVYRKDDKTTGYSLKLTAWAVKALEYSPKDLVAPEPVEKAEGKKK
jgi:single-strand DNA-binding protein